MLTREKVINDMNSCFQTEGQSIYQHGESVMNNCIELLNHLKGKIITEL